MAITAQTSGTLDDYVVNFFKWEPIEALRGVLGLAKRCRMYGSSEFIEKGDTLKIPIPPAYTAKIRTKNDQANDYEFQAANSDSKSISLSDEFYIALANTAYLSSFANPNFMSHCIRNAMAALNAQFEKKICEIVSQFSNSAIGDYTIPVSKINLGKAKKVLFDAKMPEEDRIFVVSSADMLALANDSFLEKYFVISGNEKPKIFGFEIWESQYVAMASNPSTGTRNFGAYAKDIVVATALPKLPDNKPHININDPETGISLQIYEGFDDASGKAITVIRNYFSVTLNRAECGVEIKGTSEVA